MSVARKFNKANAATTGFEIHNGLMNEETLIHLVQDNSFADLMTRYRNDKMRVFRDTYREFELKSKKYQTSGKDEKLQELVTNWIKESLSYLGYADFKEDSIKLSDDKGHVPVLRAPTDAHSVAIFLCNDIKCQSQAFETGYLLTTISGETQIDPQIKKSWTLCEQVEKSMKQAGISEALLILPYYIYYFRSDAQLSEQCLEINVSDLMRADNDEALVLATHLLNESFFRFQLSAVADEEGETVESEKEDDESEEEAEGGGATQTKITPSSNLFKEDLELARQITEELHKQVTLALELLANERIEVDSELKAASQLKGKNSQVAQELFEDGLFILYRTLFVLYAEAKKFLPIENKQYASFYSMDHLIDWAEDYLVREKRGIADHEGTYLWGALKALFTLLRRGIQLEGDMLVSPYNGQLFSPDHAKTYDNGPLLRDAAVARVLIALTKVGGDEIGRRWHFGNLGIEQLGAVYEAMLTQKPMVLMEPHEWVPAHGGGVGLVSRSFADAMELERFQKEDEAARTKRRGKSSKAKGSKNDLDTFIPKSRPAFTPTKGKFVLATMGGKRRQTASFYTPPKLAQFLVKRTLRPLVEGKTVDEILNVRLIEPAVGSGGFLIAAVRYMAEHLLKAKQRENHIDIRGLDKFTLKDIQKCKRQICEKCLYGVDINPLSVELTRTSLYLECLVEGEPLPFLHHHLKSGNSLLYAEFQNRSLTTWGNKKEDSKLFPTIFDIPADHLELKKDILLAWNDMQAAQGLPQNSDQINDTFKEKLASIKGERKSIGIEKWYSFAQEMQKSVEVFLSYVKDAQLDFEKIQNNPSIVDGLEERYKDRLAMIPDMDEVLIESYGVSVDPKLENKRKKALINEYGVKRYDQIVKKQRAYMRLKTLGDLNVSMWFWPIDKYDFFPSYGIYRELCEWLLSPEGLDRNKKSKNLSPKALKTLKIVFKTAQEHNFFHWQVEFGHIFYDFKGFSAITSNPPWKVVATKKKFVIPQLDPQFSKSKKSKRNERLKKLYTTKKEVTKIWYSECFSSFNLSNFWTNGNLSKIHLKEKGDLCTLFLMLSELLISSSGRSGLLLNKTSVYANKATKDMRVHLFGDWGLELGCSFVNTLSIFEIHKQMEFSILIGQRKKNTLPMFVNGITDPNDLEKIHYCVDHGSSRKENFEAISITLDEIKKFYSRSNYSIPAFTSEKQREMAKALHTANGSVSYIDSIASVTLIKKGLNVTDGPKKGMSKYTEDISPKDLPKTCDVINEVNTNKKWMPLFKGKHFSYLDPLLPELLNNDFLFEQYLKYEKKFQEVDFDKKTLAWKCISASDNSRTLCVSILPKGVWIDNSVWGVQCETMEDLSKLFLIWSSLASDFLLRLISGVNINIGNMLSLPIPLYNSYALNEALKIYSLKDTSPHPKKKLQAKIDALIWIHFGMGVKPLDRDGLEWLCNTQFPLIKKNDPEYIEMVLAEYDKYISDPKYTKILPTMAFKIKDEKETEEVEVKSNGSGKRKRLKAA